MYYFRRHLPHYQSNGAIFFITFRLYGSLPNSVIARLKSDYASDKALLKSCSNRELRKELISTIRQKYFERFDEFLERYDAQPQFLADPEVAKCMFDTLFFWHEIRYTLIGFCIMPNHVHLVIDLQSFTPKKYPQRTNFPLSRILESIKRYTARHSNIILDRRGHFWQKESYDRYVRDGMELNRILHYIIENPVKAGLVDSWEKWKWTYFNERYFTLENTL